MSHDLGLVDRLDVLLVTHKAAGLSEGGIQEAIPVLALVGGLAPARTSPHRQESLSARLGGTLTRHSRPAHITHRRLR